MRHRISIVAEQLVDLPNGGQELQEVTVVDQAPAEFVPLSTQERLQSGTVYASATHRACLYWQPGVTAAMVATVTGPCGDDAPRRFQIAAPPVNVREECRELELVLVERAEG
jgi:head-tail adaptor